MGQGFFQRKRASFFAKFVVRDLCRVAQGAVFFLRVDVRTPKGAALYVLPTPVQVNRGVVNGGRPRV